MSVTVEGTEMPVGGKWAEGVVYVDVETRKVPCPAGFLNANGEPMKMRWQVFAAGIAREGTVWLVYGGTEAELLAEIGDLLRGATSVRYKATREFDEMVLRGRFTNARRSHFSRPTFPAVPGAEVLPWLNIAKTFVPAGRAADDLPSKDVPAAWARGEKVRVLTHLARDIDEMILVDGKPNAAAKRACRASLGI